ncbi:hypothetical protein I2486_13630 [Cellulophaga sp. E16_2]|uniref:hypothetical protein n=1 Tax=Cellulophaga sp. E16_2 TaxID=2789297 RepID=UPI001A921A1A|nr:hypothetical protein [Cellulophaga sp. E16_2]MBO0592443.1 hypothetical protein [Cellulophaga sp. E16_2]
MIKKYTLLLCFIFLGKYTNAQDNFPSFDKIVHTFFTTYDLRTGQDSDDIRFVKKKEGYYIEEYDYNTNEFGRRALFWNADEKTYKKISFPEDSNLDTQHIEHYLTDYYKERFNTLPFFGYTGWPKDVITFLEEKSNLKEIDYYALGRAYSSSASHLLNNSSAFADTSVQFHLQESGKNQFSEEPLKLYKKYEEKAIENYTILCHKNPNYPTIVGGICNKLHNEYVDVYLNLSIYQNEEEALAFLPEGLYSDFFIDYAKNYLNSVAPNAILFTTGDNDTYPLLYAQAKLKYRQDVTIINTSLLNQSSYVNHLRNDVVMGTPPIKFTLSPETYAQEKLDVIIIGNETPSIPFPDLKNILKLLNSNDPTTLYEADKKYAQLPSKQLGIKITNQDTLKVKFKTQYLVQGEILALDIIQANIKNRPVYCAFNEIPILSHYLEVSGFVYKLTGKPQNSIENDSYLAGIDAEKTYSVLINDFKFHKITETHVGTKLSVMIGYASSYKILLNHYYTVGDLKKCKELISKFIEFYAKDLYLQTHYWTMDMTEIAYKIGATEDGAILLDYLLKNLEHEQKKNDIDNTPTMALFLKKKIFGKKKEKRLSEEKLEEYFILLSEMSRLNTGNSSLDKRINALQDFYGF